MTTTPKSTTKFGKGNPGKPKGAVNKTTGQLKEMILQALENSGGVEYLMERANDPKTASAFLTLIGKVLPMTIVGDPSNPLQHSIKVEFVKKNGTAS